MHYIMAAFSKHHHRMASLILLCVVILMRIIGGVTDVINLIDATLPLFNRSTLQCIHLETITFLKNSQVRLKWQTLLPLK